MRSPPAPCLPARPWTSKQLPRHFGASRTPVREGMRQLSTSGLVEIGPRRGSGQKASAGSPRRAIAALSLGVWAVRAICPMA